MKELIVKEFIAFDGSERVFITKPGETKGIEIMKQYWPQSRAWVEKELCTVNIR